MSQEIALEIAEQKYLTAKVRLQEQITTYFQYARYHLFSLYPEIEEIEVTGYLPYYNDGSAITYSSDISSPSISFNHGYHMDVNLLEREEKVYDEVVKLFSKVKEKRMEELYPNGFKLVLTAKSFIFEQEFTDHE